MIIKRIWHLLIILLSITLLLPSYAKNSNEQLHAPLFNNLGSFHYPISTKISLAQKFFDQGFLLYYALEDEESVRSFREATRLDPDCAMCYWGLALSLIHLTDKPNRKQQIEIQSSIQRALALSSQGPANERAYITALDNGFTIPNYPTLFAPRFLYFFGEHAQSSFDRSKAKINFAKEMKTVMDQYPNDNDAKVLYAIALMNSIDWHVWDKDAVENPVTPLIIQTLKAVLSRDPLHVGANHYYVHVMERSPHPELALVNAKRLETLAPGSEHLVHMPTHIYYKTGYFHEGTQSNLHAIATLQEYEKICKDQGFEPEMTHLFFHNYDFLIATAMMEGRKSLALKAAHLLIENLPNVKETDLTDYYWFLSRIFTTEARFGLWKDILSEPKPRTQSYQTLGVWFYARGLAFAKLGKTQEAQNSLSALQEIINTESEKNSSNNRPIYLLSIAREVLAAVIADTKNKGEDTINHLKEAMRLQHEMGYYEPPEWYFPVSEALADAFLKYGQTKQAILMYKVNLQQYPKNGWALFGLMKSYRKLGMHENEDQIKNEYKKAWRYADIPYPISLF